MTKNPPAQKALTNQQIAKTLGLSHSGVSRIRSGERLPSVAVMLKIESEYGWAIQDQAHARALGRYAQSFEKRVATAPQ